MLSSSSSSSLQGHPPALLCCVSQNLQDDDDFDINKNDNGMDMKQDTKKRVTNVAASRITTNRKWHSTTTTTEFKSKYSVENSIMDNHDDNEDDNEDNDNNDENVQSAMTASLTEYIEEEDNTLLSVSRSVSRKSCLCCTSSSRGVGSQ